MMLLPSAVEEIMKSLPARGDALANGMFMRQQAVS
jgi:hypothetical protein